MHEGSNVPSTHGIDCPDLAKKGVSRPRDGRTRAASVACSDKTDDDLFRGADVNRMNKKERDAHFAVREKQKNDAILAKYGISLSDMPMTCSIPPPTFLPASRGSTDSRSQVKGRERGQSGNNGLANSTGDGNTSNVNAASSGWNVEGPQKPIEDPSAAKVKSSYGNRAINDPTSVTEAGCAIQEKAEAAVQFSKFAPLGPQKPEPTNIGWNDPLAETPPNLYKIEAQIPPELEKPTEPFKKVESESSWSVTLVNSQCSLAVSDWDVPADNFTEASPVQETPIFIAPPVHTAPVAQSASVHPLPLVLASTASAVNTALAPVVKAIPVAKVTPVQVVPEAKATEYYPIVDLVDRQSSRAVSNWDAVDDFPHVAPEQCCIPQAVVPQVEVPPVAAPPVEPIQQIFPEAQVQKPKEERVCPASVVNTETPSEFSIWSVDLVNSESTLAVSGWDIQTDDLNKISPTLKSIPSSVPVALSKNTSWQIDKTPGDRPDRRPQYSYYSNESSAPAKKNPQAPVASAIAVPSDNITCPHCHQIFSLPSL